jgi:hypothetical protein
MKDYASVTGPDTVKVVDLVLDKGMLRVRVEW